MKHEETPRMTELDCLTAVPHLQMIKAALPYIHASEQRIFSLIVKISELERTIRLFAQDESGEIGICSLEDGDPGTPVDMLNAMKPYGTEEEQDFIDLILNFLQAYQLSRAGQDPAWQDSAGQDPAWQDSAGPGKPAFPNGPESADGTDRKTEADAGVRGETAARETPPGTAAPRLTLDQLKQILPPGQQSQLETARILMQTLQQIS